MSLLQGELRGVKQNCFMVCVLVVHSVIRFIQFKKKI